MKEHTLNGNQLKIIAMLAMTIDHLTSVLYPNYPTDWWIVGLHIIGRLAAPIFWFFIAEGYHYTRNIKKYAARLFLFAIISHFAYIFAFGIPFTPFQTSIFNQTSAIWSLAWGLVALAIHESNRFKQWQKSIIITTLNMFDATELCDQVAFIVAVRVSTLDTPHNLIMSGGTAKLKYTYTLLDRKRNSLYNKNQQSVFYERELYYG